MNLTKNFLKWEHAIAMFALAFSFIFANVACGHVYYQPEEPTSVKKLRKF